jgi:ankyrin repeat protein
MPKSNINDLLADAAYRGALDEVKALLAQGAQINALTSSMKRTAIANAACNGQFEVIKYLLEQGADPLIRAEYQRTVLINAVSYIPSTNRENYLKTVALFLQYGVDVNAEDEDGQMALHYAVRYDAFDAALLIADHGAILSKANPFRNQVTPLMSTVCHQSDAALQFLERLLSNHVELEVRDKYGKTALVHALNAGNFTAASRLLKQGAKADAPDHKGTTPLMAALAHESCPAAIVDELLQAGDRLDAQDNVGNDLRMLTASKKYQPACREKLIQHGLVIDEPALHLIFDIDNTLAQGFSIDDLATLIKEKPYVAWFQNNNLLINAVHPHILFPGTLELMQYVFSIPQVKVSFFSAGERIRNKPFVAELLIRALGKSHYDQIRGNVRIVSTHDLPKVSKSYYEQQADNADHRYYGLQSGRVKKDLTVFLAKNQKLSVSNILLVDDDESYISPQQVEHVLFVKGWPEFRHPQPAIAQSANQIFYIAGLLHKAMEQGESHHLRNYLFNQQFVKNTDKDGYRPNYRKLTTQEEFYQLGLSLLQKYNPNLSFYAQATQEFRAQLDLQEAQEQIRREEIQRIEQQQVSGVEDGKVLRPLPSFFASSSDIPSGSGANQNDVSRSDLSPS